MRPAVALILALLCSSAQAADPWVPFRKAFPGKPPPVVAEPLPPVVPFLPPELPPAPVIMAPECPCPPPPVVAAPASGPQVVVVEAPRDAKSPAPLPAPKAKKKARRLQPLQLQPKLPSERISCSEARQGVGMPCFLIRANAHVYAAYTPEQQAQAQACLTPIERAAIAACFK